MNMFIKRLRLLSDKNHQNMFGTFRYYFNNCVKIGEEVKMALEFKKAIVALESTIITHGMPFPKNIECALEVEEIIRKMDVVPATIAVINGVVNVGLTENVIRHLGDIKQSQPIKTSKRDMSYVISQKRNGGTTVSATLLIAGKVGIPIFATGGIGGVHRNVSESFDISADLIELGKTNVAVVSSGIKSILDIPKTLEYLETQGVFVATIGPTKKFPAFYCNNSIFTAPYNVPTLKDAAEVIKHNIQMNINSGMLFAVPVPSNYSIPEDVIENAIKTALEDASLNQEITGKKVTPFLLAEIANVTKEKSLEANIALIKNNARVASGIAVELNNLMNGNQSKTKCNMDKAPVVIGGSNVDCTIKLKESDIRLDGGMNLSNFTYTSGGVGRNICEALYKLGCPANFISAIGDDHQGKLLLTKIPRESSKYVKVFPNHNTSECIVIFDKHGECRFLLGDMEIHNKISSNLIWKHEEIIASSPLLILDGNLTLESMNSSLKIAQNHSIPVFYEPTDVIIADKPFNTKHFQAIKYISPNLAELRHIASALKIKQIVNEDNILQETALISKSLLAFIDNIFVTLGSNGVVIARKYGKASDPLLDIKETKTVLNSIRHYPIPEKINGIVNVSGAGDCLASGIIAAMVKGLSEEQCLSVGFAAAKASLFSNTTVPLEMFEENHNVWYSSAKYNTIQI